MMPEIFSLTTQDRHSSLWQRLTAQLQTRINELHGKLEGNQTENETAILRGQIKFAKEMLNLGNVPPIDGQI